MLSLFTRLLSHLSHFDAEFNETYVVLEVLLPKQLLSAT